MMLQSSITNLFMIMNVFFHVVRHTLKAMMSTAQAEHAPDEDAVTTNHANEMTSPQAEHVPDEASTTNSTVTMPNVKLKEGCAQLEVYRDDQTIRSRYNLSKFMLICISNDRLY